MRTNLFFLIGISYLSSLSVQAQYAINVNEIQPQISDNLDLRAVASIFGDSQNLEDFERRLNDPNVQISNLDMNNDNQVDYLRVVETIENQAHYVVIQAVLDRNVFQDVATIELSRNRMNQVNVQFIGNPNLYGSRYIYQPVYYRNPRILSLFWSNRYQPYYSSWSWNFYPKYYTSWNPHPIYRYRKNITFCLNNSNSYSRINRPNYRESGSIYRNNYDRPSNNNYNSRNDWGRKDQKFSSPNANNSSNANRNSSNEISYSSQKNNPTSTENRPNRRESEANFDPTERKIDIPRQQTLYKDLPSRSFSDGGRRGQTDENQRQRSENQDYSRRN